MSLARNQTAFSLQGTKHQLSLMLMIYNLLTDIPKTNPIANAHYYEILKH